MHHFRNKNHQEIDFLIRNAEDRFLDIEIKAAESVNTEDFRHLRWVSQQVANFTGVVLCTGEKIFSLGNGFFAVPFPAMWASA